MDGQGTRWKKKCKVSLYKERYELIIIVRWIERKKNETEKKEKKKNYNPNL